MNRRSFTNRHNNAKPVCSAASLPTATSAAHLCRKSSAPAQKSKSPSAGNGPSVGKSTTCDIDPHQQLRQQAIAAAQQGYHAVAIDLLSDLLAHNPDNATDYNNRGLVYFQCGQLDQAIADYNRALELNPNLASVYNNRANYYAAQGDLLKAIADYEMALDLNPGNTRAWINQGITLRDLGLYHQALENFDIALRLGQLAGHVHAERGRTWHLLGDWNCAIADYQKALTHLPSNGTTSATRLTCQVEMWLNELLSPLQN
jgi:tetratricopeptide (TPR) repeat protein